jgi:hypothetical protein
MRVGGISLGGKQIIIGAVGFPACVTISGPLYSVPAHELQMSLSHIFSVSQMSMIWITSTALEKH